MVSSNTVRQFSPATTHRWRIKVLDGQGTGMNILGGYVPATSYSVGESELEFQRVKLVPMFELSIPYFQKPVESLDITVIDDSKGTIRNCIKKWVNNASFKKGRAVDVKSASSQILIETLNADHSVAYSVTYYCIPAGPIQLDRNDSPGADSFPIKFQVVGVADK